MAEPKVTVQQSHRAGRRPRWCYVLHIDGFAPYVSVYRYGSAETARIAGEADLAASLAFERLYGSL